MTSETMIMSTLTLMLMYGVYSNRTEKKSRSNKANEVVEGLNLRMDAIADVASERHKRYVDRHITFEKQISENEKSVGTIGSELVKLRGNLELNISLLTQLNTYLEKGLVVDVLNIKKAATKRKPAKKIVKKTKRK